MSSKEEAQIRAFYAKHNPSKLEEDGYVAKFVSHFGSDADKMNAKLREQYGEDLSSFSAGEAVEDASAAGGGAERYDRTQTTEQAASLKAFRDALELDKASERARTFCTDGTLLRYLRARNWKQADSLKMIKASIKWQEETKPETVKCPKCLKDPMAHNMRVVGFDKHGRPVIYTCFRQAHDRFNAEANMKHSE